MIPKTLFKGSYLQDLVLSLSVVVDVCASCELTTVIIETTSIIIPFELTIPSSVTIIAINATVQYLLAHRAASQLFYYTFLPPVFP